MIQRGTFTDGYSVNRCLLMHLHTNYSCIIWFWLTVRKVSVVILPPSPVFFCFSKHVTEDQKWSPCSISSPVCGLLKTSQFAPPETRAVNSNIFCSPAGLCQTKACCLQRWPASPRAHSCLVLIHSGLDCHFLGYESSLVQVFLAILISIMFHGWTCSPNIQSSMTVFDYLSRSLLICYCLAHPARTEYGVNVYGNI